MSAVPKYTVPDGLHRDSLQVADRYFICAIKPAPPIAVHLICNLCRLLDDRDLN